MKNTPEVKPHTFTHNGDEVLILRRVSKDRKAYGNFIYPKGVDQVVTAQDFSSKQQCGGGLHGWPWGFGIGDGSNYDILEDTWLILGAKPEDIVGEIEGGYKCKVRTAVIRYDGEFTGAMAMLRDGFHACIKAMATPVIIAEGAASSVLVVSSTEKNATSSQSGDNATSSQSGSFAKSSQSGSYATSSQSGDNATSSQSGSFATSSQSGSFAKSSQSGSYATSSQSGDNAKSSQSGSFAKSSQSGSYATSSQSGSYATSSQSGSFAKSSQSGSYATSSQSGDNAKSSQSGSFATSSQSGSYATSSQSGDNATSSQSGSYATSSQSGSYATSSQSGSHATSSQSGKNCAAAIAANQGHVKTGPNGAFALAFFISDEEGWDFVTGKVGRDGIKADTWYGVKDGKLVEEAP